MFLELILKELKFFFSSTIFYAIVAVFFIIQGFLLFIFPDYNILDAGYADLKFFFTSCPYIFCIILPALCMGLFCEERKFGTMTDLICSRLSLNKIVLAKFLATSFVGTLLVACSLVYFIILWQIASPVGNLDTSSILCSYVGLEFLMLTMTSISIVGACLSKNQIISLLFSSSLCFFAYFGLESLKILFSWTSLANIFMQISLKYHFSSISKGVIDSRDLAYFILVIGISLSVSSTLLKKVIRNGAA